jgi:ferredoxin
MATKITEECINCGACEAECPNTAIYSGGTAYELNGKSFDALSADFYYIVPDKCTECVEQCAAVCPVDCCVPDPDHSETEAGLYEKAKKLHPEKNIAELSSANSRFRK